ncbi:hypothetical protein FI667_g1370, partial [Globisporangium splendens]
MALASFVGLHSAPLTEFPADDPSLTGAPHGADVADSEDARNSRKRAVLDIDWNNHDLETLESVKRCLARQNASCLCKCLQCSALRLQQRPLAQYRCPLVACQHQAFSDYLELFEHQMSAHGRIYLHGNRIRQDLFHQHRGKAPPPPITVYVDQQYNRPGYMPTQWSLERVDEERETLRAKFDAMRAALDPTHPLPRGDSYYFWLVNYAWNAFETAYAQVQQGGLAQLHAQYQMALEHYASSLVHPVDARRFQDGAASVGNGRNWLLSPEFERAKYATPFRHEIPSDDDGFSTSDGDESDGKSSTTLLLETGRAQKRIRPKAASERITPAETQECPFWQRYLEPADIELFKVSVSSRVSPSKDVWERYESTKQYNSSYKSRRQRVLPKVPLIRVVPEVSEVSEVPKKRKRGRPKTVARKPIVRVITAVSRRCTMCQELGHKNVTCSQQKSGGKKHTVQCSNCGELGHNKATCKNSPRVVKKKRIRVRQKFTVAQLDAMSAALIGKTSSEASATQPEDAAEL